MKDGRCSRNHLKCLVLEFLVDGVHGVLYSHALWLPHRQGERLWKLEIDARHWWTRDWFLHPVEFVQILNLGRRFDDLKSGVSMTGLANSVHWSDDAHLPLEFLDIGIWYYRDAILLQFGRGEDTRTGLLAV